MSGHGVSPRCHQHGIAASGTDRAEPADWLDEAAGAQSPARRHEAPLWAWFLGHGVIVLCWAVFEVASPIRGPRGWLVDGLVFGGMILVAGALLAVEGVRLRDRGQGRVALVMSGANAMLFAFPLLAAFLLGSPQGMFWILVVYLAVEGTLFWAGFSMSASLRAWGMLMGLVTLVTGGVLLVVYFAFPGGRWDILDLAFGFMGLVYSIAVAVGALQVRHTMLAGPAE